VKRVIVLACVLAILGGCRRTAVPPAEPAEARSQLLPDAENLLTMPHGASIVSRTGELTLEQTPIRLIDGEPDSHWTTPARDLRQSAVAALAAPARITAIGVTTLGRDIYAARNVRVESSLDGTTFGPLAKITLTGQELTKLVDVKPTDAQYLRVSIDDATGVFATLTTLHVRGTFLRAASLGDLSGHWSINGARTNFETVQGTVRGSIERDGTLLMEGGAEGLVYRFAWIDGPLHGLAAVTLTPDGRHLSGMKWHERAEPLTFAECWFGDRVPDGRRDPAQNDAVARQWLKKVGWYPVYGLRFNARDQLDVAQSAAALDFIVRVLAKSEKVQLTAHEMRAGSPEASRAATERRIQSLRDTLARGGTDMRRIAFLAAGSDNPPPRMPSELILGMYSMVDIRVAGSRF
jgi:hypothetical protein